MLGGLSDEFDVIIEGGSVRHNATDAETYDGINVYRTSMQTGEKYGALTNLKTSVSDYGTEDIFADENGKVYLYLPDTGENQSTADCTIDGDDRHYYGTTTTDGDGWMKMDGILEFEDPESEPIVGDTFVLKLVDSKLPDGTKVNFTLSGKNIQCIEEKTVDTTPGTQIALKATDWADYTVDVAVDDSFDSEMYWDAQGSYTGKVTHKKGIVQITEDPSKIYDGSEVEDPSVQIVSDAREVTYSYYDKNGEFLGEGKKPIDAGTYSVKATIPETDNYTKAESETVSFTIEKRPLIIELSASEEGTDATVTAIISGYAENESVLGSIKFNISMDGTNIEPKSAAVSKNSDNKYEASLCFEDVASDSYTVTAEWTGAPDNYISKCASQTFSKNKANRTIVIQNVFNKTYGDISFDLNESITNKDETGTYQFELVEFSEHKKFADAVSVDNSGNVTIQNAGIGLIKITLPENDLYTETVAYTRIVIERKELKVTPEAYYTDDPDKVSVKEKTYGSLDELSYRVTYDGFVPQSGDTAESFTNGHGTLEATSLDETTGVGTYQLGVKRVPAEGTDLFLSRNYKITECKSEITINPAVLYITADNQTGKYGIEPEYTYNFGDRDGNYALMAWDKAEDVIETIGLESGKSYADYVPGTYENAIQIYLKEKGAVNNYIFETGDASTVQYGTLTVIKGDVAIDAKIQSKTYDGTMIQMDTIVTPIVSESVSPDDMKPCEDVKITYYQIGDDGSRTQLYIPPKNAGKYVAKVVAAENSDYYNKTEKEVSFTIYKAHPDIEKPELEDIEMKEVLTLADQKLPAGWEWLYPDKELSVGAVSAYAVYTPEDTQNYYSEVKQLRFNVYEKAVPGDSDAGNDSDSDNSSDSGNNPSQNSDNADQNQADTAARTGDDSNMLIWALIAIAMLGVMLGITLVGRKK